MREHQQILPYAIKSINSVLIEVYGQVFFKTHFQSNFSENPQTSWASQTYFLFGQCSLDVQLLHRNSTYIYGKLILSGIIDMFNFSGPCAFWRSINFDYYPHTGSNRL